MSKLFWHETKHVDKSNQMAICCLRKIEAVKFPGLSAYYSVNEYHCNCLYFVLFRAKDKYHLWNIFGQCRMCDIILAERMPGQWSEVEEDVACHRHWPTNGPSSLMSSVIHFEQMWLLRFFYSKIVLPHAKRWQFNTGWKSCQLVRHCVMDFLTFMGPFLVNFRYERGSLCSFYKQVKPRFTSTSRAIIYQ